jgi:hypothetical protein
MGRKNKYPNRQAARAIAVASMAAQSLSSSLYYVWHNNGIPAKHVLDKIETAMKQSQKSLALLRSEK